MTFVVPKPILTRGRRLPSRRRRKALSPKQTKTLTVAFTRFINRIVGDFQKDILGTLTLEKATRSDAIDSELQEQFDILRLRLARPETAREIQERVRFFADRAKKTNLRAQKRLFAIEFTPELEELVEGFVQRNTSLITSLVQEQIDRTRVLVEEAARVGLSTRDLTDQIQTAFGIRKSRAELIAVDQLLTFNAAVTRETHRQAGISKYAWTTVGDERVRDEHEDLDGKVFSYERGPEETGGLHPGEPIRCRCFAFPVVEGLNQ